jgi:hypothetical protein
MQGTYWRWTRSEVSPVYQADILGSDTLIGADAERHEVNAVIPARPLSPDEARMIGVRLIEAAALCSADQVTRVIPAG